MRVCPRCEKISLYEHSVLVPLEEAERGSAAADLSSYTTCTACSSSFQCSSDSLQFVAPEDFEALGQMLWCRPRWVAESVAAEFEMSWDFVQDFFAHTPMDPAPLRPVIELLVALREAGYGSRLRAGQSMDALLLSRAREHGLRDGQSCLEIRGANDGTLSVTGVILGTACSQQRVQSRLAGWLADRVRELAALPVD